MRANPILLADEVLVRLDKLEDLGAPVQWILAQIKDLTTPDYEYETLLNWLHQMAHFSGDPQPSARARDKKRLWKEWDRRHEAFLAAIRATEKAWDKEWFAEHDHEKQEIEEVFGLTGGELSDARWYYMKAVTPSGESWLNGGVKSWWYDGVPEYAESDFAEWTSDVFATIVTDWGGPMSSLQPGGRMFHQTIVDWDGTAWNFQQSYRNSGEAACPFYGTIVGDEDLGVGRSLPGPCPLCEADRGEEHGHIYLGDGWGEFVYRRDPVNVEPDDD